jgi:uncharacterized membrane protein
MSLGYCFGVFYKQNVTAEKRRKALAIIGSSAVLLFIIIRLINSYGDALPWAKQPTMGMTIASFLNTTKYPPSLLYLLMTLGPSILLLAVLENVKGSVSRAVIHIGRVPMFFYIIHIYLIHIFAMAAASITGFGWKSMILDGWPRIEGYGFSLAITYIVWISIVLLLYPFCRWYDGFKSSNKEIWWLSYL